MQLRNIIIKNTVAGWMERIVGIVSVLLVTPILISHLGKEQYGIWITIVQGAGLMILLDFGIANTISRFVSKNLALERSEENTRVISTAIGVLLVAALIVIVIAFVFSPLVPSVLKVSDVYRKISVILFILAGLNVALIFPFRVGRGLLQAINRYDVISVHRVLINILRAILILIIFISGMGNLLFLAIITLFLGLFLELSLFVSGLERFENLRIKRSAVTLKNLKELLSLGGSAFLRTMSAMLYRRMQLIAVTIIMGVSVAPLYFIPISLLYYVGPFINRLGATFTPIASFMDAAGEAQRLRNLNVFGVRYGLLISMPFCIFLFFYGDEILKLWLGRSGLSAMDFQLMGQCLSITVVPFALSAPQIASRSILWATGKHWLVSWGFFSSNLVGLIVSILVMKYSQLGILGAAVGFSTTHFLTGILFYPLLICRHLDISKWFYFKKAYLTPVFSAGLLILVCFCLDTLLKSNDLYMFLIKVALFAVVTSLLSIYVGFLPQHRKYLFSNLKLRLRGI